MYLKLTASRVVTIMSALTGYLAWLPLEAYADEPLPPRIERVQLGDKQLTCDQIKTQYEEMGALIQKLDQQEKAGDGYAKAAATGAGAQAAIGAAGSAAPSMIPYLGHAIQAATAIMGQQMQSGLKSEMNASQRIQEAQARREHLMGLYDTKKCQ